jgi:K+-sensing histidine kinase KdpD
LRIPVGLKPALGAILCGALAVVVTILGQSKPGKAALPIWFLAAIMLTIFRFGSLAGILGTIGSAITFALYLFEPIGRLAVHDQGQKDHLMWMLLIGLALSIFAPRRASNPAKEKS